MLNYTERVTALMEDIVGRVPTLSFINLREVLVFARFGRSEAEGAYATCHCLTLPESEPGYYFWRDRKTGEITRRSEWFVTKTPQVSLAGAQVNYLISLVLPRFCDQTLRRSRKGTLYPNAEPWLAKLDTVIHELYHIDPAASGIRQMVNADGTGSGRSHGPGFYEEVRDMVQQYLATNPDPALFDFLRYDFSELEQRHGSVLATTFRNFPSYPQRYVEPLAQQPEMPVSSTARIEPIKRLTQPPLYCEHDLHVREFRRRATRSFVSARRRMVQTTAVPAFSLQQAAETNTAY